MVTAKQLLAYRLREPQITQDQLDLLVTHYEPSQNDRSWWAAQCDRKPREPYQPASQVAKMWGRRGWIR